MNVLFPGSSGSENTVVAVLFASIILLVSLLAGIILSRNANKEGLEERHAIAALIEGVAALVQQIAFGVIGAPFSLIGGIAALVSAYKYRKRTEERSGIYRAGFILGLFGLIAGIFAPAVIVVALNI